MSDTPITIFFTKAKQVVECPQLYKLCQHDHITPKIPAVALHRGSCVHKSGELFHKFHREQGMEAFAAQALAMARMERWTNQDPGNAQVYNTVKDLVQDMSDGLCTTLAEYKTIEAEKTVDVHICEDRDGVSYNFIWRVKADSIIAHESGIGNWSGEYKSSAAYGSKTRAMYHRGIQPWTYFYLLDRVKYMAPLAGIKLFVATKTLKNPPKNMKVIPHNCTVEDLPTNPVSLRKAEDFVFDAVRQVMKLEASRDFYRDRRTCINIFGECAYAPLCEPGAIDNPSYRADVLKTMFKTEDPEAHLEES